MLRRWVDWVRTTFFRGWPSPEAFLWAVILPIVMCTPGCSGSLERARSQPRLGAAPATAERCITLDDRRAFFGAAGKTLAILGGGTGLATIPATDDRLETGLAIGSMGAAALAAGAVYVSEQSGTSWARECSAK